VVSDHGPGRAAASREPHFEPFSRREPAANGLGLAIRQVRGPRSIRIRSPWKTCLAAHLIIELTQRVNA